MNTRSSSAPPPWSVVRTCQRREIVTVEIKHGRHKKREMLFPFLFRTGTFHLPSEFVLCQNLNRNIGNPWLGTNQVGRERSVGHVQKFCRSQRNKLTNLGRFMALPMQRGVMMNLFSHKSTPHTTRPSPRVLARGTSYLSIVNG